MPLTLSFSRAGLILGVCVLCILGSACTQRSTAEMVASGREYLEKSDHASAIVQLKAALQQDIASTEARALLGRALFESGDVDGAVVELTKALDDGASKDQVLPLLSRALLVAGNYRKLTSSYGEAKLEDPKARADFQSVLALGWAMLGGRQKAEAAVQAALQADPRHVEARLTRARMWVAQGKVDEATRLVDEVLVQAPKDADALLLKGELLFSLVRDRAAAEKYFVQAAESKPKFMAAHAAVVALRLRSGNVEGARAQVQRMREVAPAHAHTVLADAQLSFIDGKDAEARTLVQSLLRSYPDHEDALALSGAIEARLGSLAQASANLGKALALNPELDTARVKLAEVEVRLGQHARALKTLEPLIKGDSPRVEALAAAGNASLRLGNSAAAEEFFRRAAGLDPANVRLKTAAVMARMSIGDPLQALVELESLASSSKDTVPDEALVAARLRRGEVDSALRAIDAMASKAPKAAAPHELRGRVLLARRDLPAARKAFAQALELDPSLYDAVASLAFIDVLEGRPADAMGRLQRVVDTDPKNALAMTALAELKSRHDAPIAEVFALFDQAVKAAPNDPEPRLKQIEYLLRKRQFKDALASANAAVAALPSDAKVLEAAGRAQLQAGDVEQAITSFRRLATAMPDSPTPFLRLAELHGLARANEQAIAAASKAIEIAPESAEAQLVLIDTLSRAGRAKEALAFASRVRQSKPASPVGYALEALYHFRKGDNDAVLASLLAGVRQTRSGDLAGKYYSQLLKLRRQAEADQFADSWLRQSPGDAAFEYLVSVSDIAKGDLASAEARLRRVVAVFPDNVIALNNLAYVLATRKKPGAVEWAQRAVDIEPDRPELLDTLALALASENRLEPALQIQRRALRLEPNNPGLKLGLARLALQAGDRALARQELDQLEKLGTGFSDHEAVKQLRRQL